MTLEETEYIFVLKNDYKYVDCTVFECKCCNSFLQARGSFHSLFLRNLLYITVLTDPHVTVSHVESSIMCSSNVPFTLHLDTTSWTTQGTTADGTRFLAFTLRNLVGINWNNLTLIKHVHSLERRYCSPVLRNLGSLWRISTFSKARFVMSVDSKKVLQNYWSIRFIYIHDELCNSYQDIGIVV